MWDQHPDRKPTRLRGYDYAETGWYFVTICTYDRERILSDIREQQVCLTQLGAAVQASWRELPKRFVNIQLDALVIMPDHVHAVVGIAMSCSDRASKRSNLVHVIGKWKSDSGRHINNIRNTRGLLVWQRSFYDHIIRDEEDLRRVRQYIADNPRKWRDDVVDDGQIAN